MKGPGNNSNILIIFRESQDLQLYRWKTIIQFLPFPKCSYNNDNREYDRKENNKQMQKEGMLTIEQKHFLSLSVFLHIIILRCTNICMCLSCEV